MGLLLFLAITVRLFFALGFPQPVVKDAASYDQLGINLSTTGRMWMFPGGNPDPPELLVRTPGYPVFLGLIYKLGGHSPQLVRVAQAFLDTGTCLLVFFLSRLVGCSTPVSLLALALAALNPFTSAYVGSLLSENLGIFVFVLSFCFLYLAIQREKTWLFVITGITFGALTLCRPHLALLSPIIFLFPFFAWLKKFKSRTGFISAIFTVLAITPYFTFFGLMPSFLSYLGSFFFIFASPLVLLLWFAISGKGKGEDEAKVEDINNAGPEVKGFVLMAIFSVLAVLPWTYRNYQVSGKFVPLVVLVYPSGGDYYLGTLPVPLGKDPMEVDEKWKQFVSARGEELEKLRKEMGETGYRRLITRPHQYFWLTFRRAVRLWNQGNLFYYLQLKRWAWGIFTTLNLAYYLLGFLGIWATRKQWRKLFPFYLPFIYVTILLAPIHAEPRYSIAMFPIVCLFGGAGLYSLRARSQRRNQLEGESLKSV